MIRNVDKKIGLSVPNASLGLAHVRDIYVVLQFQW